MDSATVAAPQPQVILQVQQPSAPNTPGGDSLSSIDSLKHHAEKEMTRQQTAASLLPPLFVLLWFLTIRLVGWAQRRPRYFTFDTTTLLWFAICGCVGAMILMVAFYLPSRRDGVAIKRVVLWIWAVFMVGCVLVDSLSFSFYLCRKFLLPLCTVWCGSLIPCQ